MSPASATTPGQTSVMTSLPDRLQADVQPGWFLMTTTYFRPSPFDGSVRDTGSGRASGLNTVTVGRPPFCGKDWLRPVPTVERIAGANGRRSGPLCVPRWGVPTNTKREASGIRRAEPMIRRPTSKGHSPGRTANSTPTHDVAVFSLLIRHLREWDWGRDLV